MTPKEKAKYLVGKFYFDDFNEESNLYEAKKHALLAVDEILSWNKTYFWEQVRIEIENL